MVTDLFWIDLQSFFKMHFVAWSEMKITNFQLGLNLIPCHFQMYRRVS